VESKPRWLKTPHGSGRRTERLEKAGNKVIELDKLRDLKMKGSRWPGLQNLARLCPAGLDGHGPL
jgi:hypothetical protein